MVMLMCNSLRSSAYSQDLESVFRLRYCDDIHQKVRKSVENIHKNELFSVLSMEQVPMTMKMDSQLNNFDTIEELYARVAESEEQFAKGNYITSEELFSELDKEFHFLGK